MQETPGRNLIVIVAGTHWGLSKNAKRTRLFWVMISPFGFGQAFIKVSIRATLVWAVVQGARQPPKSLHPGHDDEPPGQGVQDPRPSCELYVPAGHAVQAKPVLRSEYVPSGQFLHDEDPAVENCPGLHGWHNDTPVKGPEEVPAGHGVHAANPVLASE